MRHIEHGDALSLRLETSRRAQRFCHTYLTPLSDRCASGGGRRTVAVVLPGTFFPLAHFGVVALKRVAMRQVARKMDPELQVQLERGYRTIGARPQSTTQFEQKQFNKKIIILLVVESGPHG